MSSSRPRPPEADFLPSRTETLRESFQEKMRRKGGHRAPRVEPGGEIRLLEIHHGPHPEIEPLNERFTPGRLKLKVTLDVFGMPDYAEGVPPATVPLLMGAFPNLVRHRCCGANDLHTTLFRRKRRPGCALPSADAATDLCHLLEHLAIDLIVAIGPDPSCSGLTCAYRAPENRFDLFLECEDPRAAMAALRCAGHVLRGALEEGEIPAGASRYAETARYFLGRPRSVLSPGDVLVHLQGDPGALEAALKFLAVAGFLVEERFTFDFEGTVLYRYRLAPAPPDRPENLFA
jgi:hypothetical protein